MSKNEAAMADDEVDEEELTEAALEIQLQEHLVEQKASLIALEEALAVDPSNQELLAVHEELTVAIKGAEESLLQLKRTRLLGEIDAALGAQDNEKEEIQGVLNASSQSVPLEDSTFPTGSKCRFRHVDGRWYNGQVIELENEELLRVSFLTPTTEKMQICKFYMQKRCRFGGNCRMSHGVLVPRDALRQFVSPTLQHSSVGSAVLACLSPNGEGIWRQAELESWDEALQSGRVIFVDDGSRLEVGLENLSISEYADVTDEETTSSEDDEDESEEVEDDGDCDEVTFGTPVTAGAQTDTRVFAHWEKHTRGMASKMMANMGYREGMGLGRTGQGIVTPLQVKALPKHQSLDFISDALHQDEGTSKASGKKKSRGGKRKRDRKLAEAARAVKAEEARAPDVFGFINNQLAGQHGHTVGTKESAENKSHRRVKVKVHKEDRRSLIAQADEVADLRNKVEKLEEMALRNKKDKVVYDAVARKLEESRRALLKAEADHLSASLAVHSKEREKKWLRF